MRWYLGILLGYSLAAGLIMKANPRIPDTVLFLLVAGFLLANFLGIGIGIRDRSDTVSSGARQGIRLGGYWLAGMAVMLTFSLIAAVVLTLGGY